MLKPSVLGIFVLFCAMNTKFSIESVVQAIDTITGVWRHAQILQIEKRSVDLRFADFPKNRADLHIEITPQMAFKTHEAQWPIRRPLLAIEHDEGRRKRGPTLDYKPEKLIATDTVFIKENEEIIK